MSEDILERAKIIAEKMGDRRIYYAGCWTLAEDLGYSKTGENTEFKEVAHPEDFIWCEVLPGINLLPELIAEVEANRALIGQTAKNFLQLQPGIPWAGGIDAAMKAMVEEVERLRRLMGVVENTSRHRSNRLEEQIEALVIQKSAKDARIKKLEAELENLNGMGTVGYMLGYKKTGTDIQSALKMGYTKNGSGSRPAKPWRGLRRREKDEATVMPKQ